MGASRRTTPADVEVVLKMSEEGHTYSDIRGATGLTSNTITRILNGWRPSGKKPVRFTKNRYRRGE